MKLTNRLSLPQPIVDAVANDDYTQGEASISVTELISPPRLAALKRQYDDQLEEDVADRIYALLGQSVASILERANAAPALAEQRLYMDVDGHKVSGQFDRMALTASGDGWDISDWKLCSVWEIVNGLKSEREQQLNCYAELARHNGYRVSGLEIVAILRDWSKMKAMREPATSDYPRQQVAVVPVALWDTAKTKQFISDRLKAHLEARSGNLPLCTAEERWQKAPVYAVHKPNRKSALRLFEKAQEAAIFSAQNPGTWVVERPGENTRCAHYCPVGGTTGLCSQYAREAQNAA